MGKLVMRVAHVAPIRARCFNSKRTSFHVALELEHVESVDLRSAIRKADAVLPAFAREGQRGHTVKRVARRGRCRLLFLLGVQHIHPSNKKDAPSRLPGSARAARRRGSSRRIRPRFHRWCTARLRSHDLAFTEPLGFNGLSAEWRLLL